MVIEFFYYLLTLAPKIINNSDELFDKEIWEQMFSLVETVQF